jgi:hypothetical protein
MITFRFLGWAFALVLLGSVGCSSGTGPAGSPANDEDALKMIGGQMFSAIQISKRPPRNADELEADLKKLDYKAMGLPPDFPQTTEETMRAVRSGRYVIIWGADYGHTVGSDDILAYPKDAPEKGGPVLVCNGFVVTMTTDQFKKAKLAKPRDK